MYPVYAQFDIEIWGYIDSAMKHENNSYITVTLVITIFVVQ